VLVSGPDVLPALATHVSDDVLALTERFWPGGLTVIVWAQASLSWDLGDTGGTVAVRVPDHPVALDLLRSTGPLAVSSANLSGRPPATTAARAQSQLSGVEVYLEAGPVGGHPSDSGPALPSSIVDATGDTLRLVRAGAISLADLREVVPGLEDGVTTVKSPSTQEADGGG
jgi:tRNA threonylcarbamoyl adenosine modification protein (Sua5/YciO/YrdC/YwlC family)